MASLATLTIADTLEDLASWVIPRAVPAPYHRYLVTGFLVSLITLPGLIATVLVYATGKPFGDGETRCRKCGYILYKLDVPRCPECLERI